MEFKNGEISSMGCFICKKEIKLEEGIALKYNEHITRFVCRTHKGVDDVTKNTEQ